MTLELTFFWCFTCVPGSWHWCCHWRSIGEWNTILTKKSFLVIGGTQIYVLTDSIAGELVHSNPLYLKVYFLSSTLNAIGNSFIVVDCGTPKNGTNTEPVNSSLSILYEQTYNYTCQGGYSTEDEVSVTCMANWTWSSSPPHCGKFQRIKVFVLNYMLLD